MAVMRTDNGVLFCDGLLVHRGVRIGNPIARCVTRAVHELASCTNCGATIWVAIGWVRPGEGGVCAECCNFAEKD